MHSLSSAISGINVGGTKIGPVKCVVLTVDVQIAVVHLYQRFCVTKKWAIIGRHRESHQLARLTTVDGIDCARL